MGTRILLVDDHTLFRRGLRALLEKDPDLVVVGEADNGEEAVALASDLLPDAVLMDISMPDLNGVEATRRIISAQPDIKIVALSIHSGKQFIEDMLRAGAMGYVLKESAPEEVTEALRAVMEGEVFLSAAVTRTVVSQLLATPLEHVEVKAPEFARTKLQRPLLSSDAIPRPSLVGELEQNISKPLTLLSAPAGYGKSILTALWLEQVERPSAWLSLDTNDDDLRTFLRGFIIAVQSIFPATGQQTLSLLNGPTLPPQRILTLQLLNDLEQIDSDFILVLDDYHMIRDQAVHELMCEVLRYPPPPMHLVVLTRRDPPLPVNALRGRDQVHEVPLQKLRFSPQETVEFLGSVLGRTVDAKAAQTIEACFEGWPVGLRLLAHTLKHHENVDALLEGLTGDLGSTTEYLITEVLSQQPEAVSTCLLKISILDRFCEPLCAEFCPPMDGANQAEFIKADEFMDWLRENNLFLLALDLEGCWYRFHHLLKQVLRVQLERQWSPQEIAALHSRASRWFEDEGLLGEAIHHALAGNDDLGAAQIVERHRHNVLDNDKWYGLKRLLDKLPLEVKRERHELLLAQAWVFFHQLDFQSILAILEELESSDNGGSESVLGEIDLFRGYFWYFQGHGSRSSEHLSRAIEMIPESFQHVRGEVELHHALSLHMIGEKDKALRGLQHALRSKGLKNVRSSRLWSGLHFIHLLEGALYEVLVPARKVQELGTKDGDIYVRCWGLYAEACALFFQSAQKKTLSCLNQILEILLGAHSRLAFDALCGQVLLSQATEDAEGAKRALRHLRQYAIESDEPIGMTIASSCRARLALLQGDIESALRWLRTADLTPDEGITLWWFEVPRITACRVLIAEGTDASLKQAVTTLEKHVKENRTINNNLRLIEVLALLSAAFSKQSKPKKALATLEEAVSIARPGGVVQPFIELGRPMVDMLRSLEGHTEDAFFIGRLLERFEALVDPPLVADDNDTASLPVETQSSPPEEAWTPAPAQPLVDPLTVRELDVLELLEKRLRDKEMAEHLCVSPHTVKSHLKNLYQKLDVGNRLEAVSKARSLGLLSSR